MLLKGCWAVRVAPAVCVWNLSMADFGFLGLNLLVINSYQISLATRNFEISSKILF